MKKKRKNTLFTNVYESSLFQFFQMMADSRLINSVAKCLYNVIHTLPAEFENL